MGTTLKNFVKEVGAALVGSAVGAAGAIVPYDPIAAAEIVAGGGGTLLDKILIDFSTDGYAKHGMATVALPGTTKVSLDLTNMATATSANGGDASYATWNVLVLMNAGAASFTIAPGSANPANGIAAGTTPTITLQPGGVYVLTYPVTGNTVDSTHKIIDITPSATTSAVWGVAGA
jgi:hypothetical protein